MRHAPGRRFFQSIALLVDSYGSAKTPKIDLSVFEHTLTTVGEESAGGQGEERRPRGTTKTGNGLCGVNRILNALHIVRSVFNA